VELESFGVYIFNSATPALPNPDKPEPTLSAKTKKTKEIEFGSRFDRAHRRQELIKVKTKFS
jgi:hypothetical protein